MRYANVVVELNLLSTNSGMNPDLKTLIELQRLDDIIRGLYAEVLSLPQTISRLEAELAGDILAVDNLVISHGRRPYTGERRILTILTG